MLTERLLLRLYLCNTLLLISTETKKQTNYFYKVSKILQTAFCALGPILQQLHTTYNNLYIYMLDSIQGKWLKPIWMIKTSKTRTENWGGWEEGGRNLARTGGKLQGLTNIGSVCELKLVLETFSRLLSIAVFPEHATFNSLVR